MVGSKSRIAVALAFVLLVTFVAPVLALDYSPGVKVGDYVKFGNYVSVNTQNEWPGAWLKQEVVEVSGKEVKLLTTGEFKNGTKLLGVGVTFYNLETGETNETHGELKSIMAANLQQGDVVPPGKLAINTTEIRTYLKVSRTVNILILEQSLSDLNEETSRITAVYDKASGLSVEWETYTIASGREISLRYEVVETNLWQVNPPNPPPLENFFIIAVAAAVAIPITAVLAIRKRKQSEGKAKMREQKVMDLTYNLSGVNRGDSYLSSSLPQCLKIVCDLHSRGVNSLCIVREDPETIVNNCGLKPEEVILLSSKPIKGFKAVDSLQEIAIIVMKFLKANGGVVLLDGLSYLISRFDFNSVYMCLQEKKIEFMEAGAVLLVPVNMETLDNREKGLLLSELKLL